MRYSKILLLATVLSVAALAAPQVLAETPAPAQVAGGSKSIALGSRSDITFSTPSCVGDANGKALWLDGMDTGIRAAGCDEENKRLVFNISQKGEGATEKTAAAWHTLLSNPFHSDSNFRRDVNFSIVESGKVVAVGKTKLELLDTYTLTFSVVILLVVIGMLLFGALKSGLLRDAGLPPDGNTANRPFSLARVQMVWWFTILFISYILQWLLMKELPSIPASALGLIGMAGGTALAGAAIDKGRPTQQTQGFWVDITTDADGVTLPRLQQIAWTLLLGFVFLDQVVEKLSMPDFPSSVLALMGISGGLYLGFKVPENHVKSDPNQAAGAPNDTNNDGKAGYGST